MVPAWKSLQARKYPFYIKKKKQWAEEPDQYIHHTEGPAVVGVAVEESCGHELATIPFTKVVRISVVELNAISHPWFWFGEISQMSKENSSALHPAHMKSLCEQRGDGPPVFPALQLQKERLPPPALKTWWMWTLSAISRILSETST